VPPSVQAALQAPPQPALGRGGSPLPPVQEDLPTAVPSWQQSAHAFVTHLQTALAELASKPSSNSAHGASPSVPRGHSGGGNDSDPGSTTVSVQITSQPLENPAASSSISVAASGSSAIRGFFGAAAAWNRPQNSGNPRRGTGKVSCQAAGRLVRDSASERLHSLAMRQPCEDSSAGISGSQAILRNTDFDSVSVRVPHAMDSAVSPIPGLPATADNASFAFDNPKPLTPNPKEVGPLLDAPPQESSQSWTASWWWRKGQPISKGSGSVASASCAHQTKTSAAVTGSRITSTLTSSTGSKAAHRERVEQHSSSYACSVTPQTLSDLGSWRSQPRTEGFTAVKEQAAAAEVSWRRQLNGEAFAAHCHEPIPDATPEVAHNAVRIVGVG
jgi:hypothetical protein